MALDVAAEHVVGAEQGGGQEEEPGSEIIMETEGDIINLGRDWKRLAKPTTVPNMLTMTSQA